MASSHVKSNVTSKSVNCSAWPSWGDNVQSAPAANAKKPAGVKVETAMLRDMDGPARDLLAASGVENFCFRRVRGRVVASPRHDSSHRDVEAEGHDTSREAEPG